MHIQSARFHIPLHLYLLFLGLSMNFVQYIDFIPIYKIDIISKSNIVTREKNCCQNNCRIHQIYGRSFSFFFLEHANWYLCIMNIYR